MRELREDLAGLAPNDRLVVDERSRRYVHQTQLDVVSAIEQAVEAVRDPSTWATPPAGTPAT
jgi:hypothetical protein